ncbi:MAG: hypothetical protein ACHP7D_03105 [Lysobacterales bacterium]
MARTLYLLLALAAGICLPQFALAFNVYTVGGDGACGYAFIQDAIDAAAANPGEDYVFIATNRTYDSQHLVVTDDDVDIVGGFPDCTQLGDPGLAQTTINGTSGHSVFEIEGNSHVYLSNLVITGAVMDDSHHGGGIYFGGAGGLELRYSWVFNNQAGYGGGIAVNPSGPTTLTLLASTVSANTALVTGGGIQIEGPTTLNALPIDADTNYIAQNAAQGGDGGGIKVIGPAVANIASGVVDLNTAAAGGGISAVATSQGPAYVNLYTSNPGIPVTLYGNTASQNGGGVFLVSRAANLAKLCAFDFAIDANNAISGGAIMAAVDDNGNGSIAFLNSPGCDRPADAVACAPGAACNEVNDNVSSTNDPTGTIHIGSAGALSASRFAMRRNTATSLIRFDADAAPSNGGGDYVHLHDCLLVDNTLSSYLLDAFGGAAQTQVIVDTCTVTNNSMPANDNAYVLDADTNFAEVTNSIIYQPLQRSLIFGGPAGDLTARYILTNDTIPFTGYPGIVDGMPLFVDVANGDYHQARNSPGVDFAPANDGVDLDGNPRTLDLIDVPDQWGPLDVGAYEIQTQEKFTCSVADTIFCNGFDG